MHTGKQKQVNASYQASLVNRHIKRFTGLYVLCVLNIFIYVQVIRTSGIPDPECFKKLSLPFCFASACGRDKIAKVVEG